MKSSKFFLIIFILLITLISCPVGISEEILKEKNQLKNQMDNTIILPENVKNLEASILEDDRIILSFNGQKSTEFSSLYYVIKYRIYGEVDEKSYTVPANFSGIYSIPFYLKKGTHAVFSVQTCAEFINKEGKKEVKIINSEEVEGAVLPEIILDKKPGTNSTDVELYWDVTVLNKKFTQGELLYDSYSYSLVRITRGIETVIYNNGRDDHFTDKPFGTASYKLYLNLGYKEVASETISVKGSSILKCPPVKEFNVSTSSYALKEGIKVSWIMPILPEDVDINNTAYRFKLERTKLGEDSWEEIIGKYTDVYSDDYEYTLLEKGETSFSYMDYDVEPNTKYQYRISAFYYLINDGFIDYESDPAVSEESYRRFEPTLLRIDLENSNNVLDAENAEVNFNIMLSWNFEGETNVQYNEITPTYRLIRINEKDNSQVVIDDIDFTSLSYNDSFVLEDDSIFNDASYSYVLQIKYADDDFSEEIHSDCAYEYEGADEFKQLIKNVRASTNLAGKVTLNWEFRNKGEELYDAGKITYKLYSGDSRTNILNPVTDVEFNKNTVSINNLPDDYSSYYRLVSEYVDDENILHEDVQVSKNEGKTLGTPTLLEVTEGKYISKIDGSFNSVDNVTSYLVKYRVSGSDDIWQEKEVNTLDSFTIEKEDLSEEAGTLYDFNVYAIDTEGNMTHGCASDTGCLFGLANLNSSIISDLDIETDKESNSFTVNWNGSDIKGAFSYQVDVVIPAKDNISSGTLPANTFEYIFDSSDFDINNDSVLPSDGFDVVLTVYNKENEKISKNIGKAIWLYAPTNIKAAKAESMDSITVSWNVVPNANGYKIYIKHGVEEDYKELTSVFVTTTSYVYKFSDIADGTYPDTYFKVQAVLNNHVSEMVNTFSFDSENEFDNLGYVLKAPEYIVPRIGDSILNDSDTFKVEWTKVKGAEWYVITDKKGTVEKEYVVSNDDLTLETNGNVSYNFPDMEMTSEVNWNHDFSIKAARVVEGIEIYSKSSSTVSFQVYRYLSAKETLNVLHSKLNVHLKAADYYFWVDQGKDWWPYSANIFSDGDNSLTYTYSNGSENVKIQNTKGTDAFGHTGESSSQTDANRGRILITNLSLGGGLVVSSKDIRIGVTGSIAGGDNDLKQLRTTGNPTFTISYPSKFDKNGVKFTSTVNISSDITFRKDEGLAGGYTVNVNGKITNISYSDYINLDNSIEINAKH